LAFRLASIVLVVLQNLNLININKIKCECVIKQFSKIKNNYKNRNGSESSSESFDPVSIGYFLS